MNGPPPADEAPAQQSQGRPQRPRPRRNPDPLHRQPHTMLSAPTDTTRVNDLHRAVTPRNVSPNRVASRRRGAGCPIPASAARSVGGASFPAPPTIPPRHGAARGSLSRVAAAPIANWDPTGENGRRDREATRSAL